MGINSQRCSLLKAAPDVAAAGMMPSLANAADTNKIGFVSPQTGAALQAGAVGLRAEPLRMVAAQRETSAESACMKYTVEIENTGERYECNDDRNLLAGMEKLGRKGIPVGCRNGGCGV